jgi:hypothetical protein
MNKLLARYLRALADKLDPPDPNRNGGPGVPVK